MRAYCVGALASESSRPTVLTFRNRANLSVRKFGQDGDHDICNGRFSCVDQVLLEIGKCLLEVGTRSREIEQDWRPDDEVPLPLCQKVRTRMLVMMSLAAHLVGYSRSFPPTEHWFMIRRHSQTDVARTFSPAHFWWKRTGDIALVILVRVVIPVRPSHAQGERVGAFQAGGRSEASMRRGRAGTSGDLSGRVAQRPTTTTATTTTNNEGRRESSRSSHIGLFTIHHSGSPTVSVENALPA